MRRRNAIPLVLGRMLLVYSAAFAAFDILTYDVGLSAVRNPYEAIASGPQPSLMNDVMDVWLISVMP